jgi:hypothetical protein
MQPPATSSVSWAASRRFDRTGWRPRPDPSCSARRSNDVCADWCHAGIQPPSRARVWPIADSRNRTSSSFLAALSCAMSHRGCLPRPAHVSDGFYTSEKPEDKRAVRRASRRSFCLGRRPIEFTRMRCAHALANRGGHPEKLNLLPRNRWQRQDCRPCGLSDLPRLAEGPRCGSHDHQP